MTGEGSLGISVSRPAGADRHTVLFEGSAPDVPDTWFWQFGDGATSTAQHPTHTYGRFGRYTVDLTVRYGSEIQTLSRIVIVGGILQFDSIHYERGFRLRQDVYLDKLGISSSLCLVGITEDGDPYTDIPDISILYPTYPDALNDLVDIACEGRYIVGLRADGTVVSTGDTHTPGWANGIPSWLTGVTQIALGQTYTGLALRADGTVVTWGELGDPPTGLSDVVQIAAGSGAAFALKSDGTVVAWGHNNYWHQLNVPAGLTDVIQIGAHKGRALALRADGTVVTWGGYDRNYGLEHPYRVPTGLRGKRILACGQAVAIVLDINNAIHTLLADNMFSVLPSYPYPPDVDNIVSSFSTHYLHYISAVPILLSPPPVPEFMASPRVGSPPLDVQFLDLTVGEVASWFWQFGDGATSTAQHPTHTYLNEGRYIVTLTISDDNGTPADATGIVTVRSPPSRRRRAAWMNMERPLF